MAGQPLHLDPKKDRALSGPQLGPLPRSVARLVRLALRPHAPFARRRMRARMGQLRAAALDRSVLDAWRSVSAPAGAAWVVPLDPADLEAAKIAIEAGARLAPGGLRWLADRYDAARSTSTDSAAGANPAAPGAPQSLA